MQPSHIHHSAPAKSGPPNDPPQPAPGRRPTPPWLHTLWVLGLLLTLLLLFTPSSNSSTTSLTYSAWKTKVDAGEVKTASIDPSGKVTGLLTNKKHYQSRIPSALKDDALADELTRHHVGITGTTSTTSFWSIVGGLLPLLFLLGLFFWFSRRASKQIAGGIMGIGA